MICNNASNEQPHCGICGTTEDMSFRFHRNGTHSYFFCMQCTQYVDMDGWLALGDILEWLEIESPQARLI